MNLVIDQGNTRVKVAVFDQKGNLLQLKKKAELREQDIYSLLNEYPYIKQGIYSSVSDAFPAFLKQAAFHCLEMSTHLRFPFENRYTTPETLGLDRLALVSAAAFTYPSQNVLVIDAGTCITYDFINEEGQYLGGAISPGFNMRLKAMHHFTARLPLPELQKEVKLIGNSTHSSLLSGAVKGTRKEIEGIIQEYSDRYSPLITVITGGDVSLLEEMVKNTIFAAPDFLLSGLNYITEYNAERP